MTRLPQHVDEAEFRRRASNRLLPLDDITAADARGPAIIADADLNPDAVDTMDGDALVPAAVLVPLLVSGRDLSVLFTQRSNDLPAHAGQISFPGGRIDPSDAGPVETALRETHEETGVDPAFVETLGLLDPYNTGTGFRIVPVVGLISPGFTLQPHPAEVAEIFEVPLSFLMNPANHKRHEIMWKGARRRYYAMPYLERYIWGATAGILRNLYARLYGSQ